MKEGLYKIEFQTPLGTGTGVVYLRDGQLWGGDAEAYYIGSYRVTDEEIVSHVSIDRHSGNPDLTPFIFGFDKVSIKLTGRAVLGTIMATGTSDQAPDVRFDCVLSFLYN